MKTPLWSSTLPSAVGNRKGDSSLMKKLKKLRPPLVQAPTPTQSKFSTTSQHPLHIYEKKEVNLSYVNSLRFPGKFVKSSAT